MENKATWILIVVVVGLGLLVLLPERTDEGAGEEPLAESSGDEELLSKVIHQPEPEKSIAAPADGVPHSYFPIVAGSKWVYQVRGFDKLVPSETWTLKIVKAPQGSRAGEIMAGFGENLKGGRIWYENKAVRMDVMPHAEPMEFLGDRPLRVSGYLVPYTGALVEGATWNVSYDRKVEHMYTDGRGREVTGPASGKQTDRAVVKGFEPFKLPSGNTDSVRVDWTSRIELEMDGRKLLESLTVETYRKESMWLVKGIGIVQRRVSYPKERSALVTYDLLRYERPDGPSN